MKIGGMRVTKPATLVALEKGEMHNALISEAEGGIEGQEKAGQKQFVANETLPKECPRKELESLGFVFGQDADALFVNVQFPQGWKKVATDHSMWSNLIDDTGQKRGSIFSKAAFYDRRAFMILDEVQP